MTEEIRLKMLQKPQGKVDIILDTDAYNEVDDQYAISYMVKAPEKLNPVAIYAAPFFNQNSASPEDGMLRSYEEILKISKNGRLGSSGAGIPRIQNVSAG